MRSASLLGCLTLTALLGLAGEARTDPYVATIQVDQTDARAGRGDGAMSYPTNHFRLGDRVRVIREEDGGWLAIAPPSGSFSWIRKDLLYIDSRQQPPLTVVNAEAADVRIGSAMTAEPPLVIGKRVARGTIITPLPNGLEKADKDGAWLPIVPPDGEVRYLRADAVQKPASTPAERAATVITVPAGNTATVQDADALYKRATEAEKWNPQEAIALYNQGANNDANPDRRIQALNRATWLRDNLRNPAQTLVPGPPPGADLRVATAPSESKVYPLADSGPTPVVRLAPPQGAGVPTVASSNAWSATPTASYSEASTPRAPAGPVPANGSKTYSTGPGVLRSSGHPSIEGRKAYLMYTDKNVPFYYVTDWTGGELEKYLNRRVELSGEAITSGELRMNYMRAARVEMREGQ